MRRKHKEEESAIDGPKGQLMRGVAVACGTLIGALLVKHIITHYKASGSAHHGFGGNTKQSTLPRSAIPARMAAQANDQKL